jgi:transglutaminase-like putative cysteine protease
MTQDRRMTLTVAVAVVLVSTVLFPAFQGSGWFYEGVGAVLAVAGAATLSRLRTLPVVVCLLISLIGLLLYLNLVFEAGRSIIGFIPSSASMTALGELTRVGFDDASKYAAPAPTTSGLVLLSTAGIGLTAVLTDLIAVRLRSAAMAGLPLLVLFTVPVAINQNRGPVTIIVIFALATSGYLALLSADGRERIRVWGRLISLWRTNDGQAKDPGPAADTSTMVAKSFQVLRGPDTRALAAAGRRVGLASIVLALCTPLLIPGLHAARITSANWVIGPGSGTSNGPGLYNPLAGTAQELKESKPNTVLTYTTSASTALQALDPQYLQQYVYTTLTSDDGWQLPFSAGNVDTKSVTPQLGPQAPGISNAGAPQVRTEIAISQSAGFSDAQLDLLPAPFVPSMVYAPGNWQYDPATLMIVTTRQSLNGLDYTVYSHDVDPSSTVLSSLAYPPAMPEYTQLPTSYKQSAPLMNLALRLTDGQTTEYGKVTAIENWLSNSGGFTYYTFAPQINDVFGLLNYLEKTKSGDCVQSAFAMTVMLRMLGIPARLATGFTQGTKTSANRYVVKTSDAHAWPEVYFRGYGWLTFAPTPPGPGTAVAPGYDHPGTPGPATTNPGQTGGTTPATNPSTGANRGGRGFRKPLPQDGEGPVGSLPAITAKHPAGTPWLALALAVLAGIGLVWGLVSMVTPGGHRTHAARPAAAPRQRVSLGTALTALAVAGVVALALYRVLSHTKGLSLGSGWATVGIAFGATCAALLVVPAISRAVVRRWRWMRAGDDDADLAHAAWEELRADLADYGVGYLPSESPRALAARVTTGLALPEPAVEALHRIALAEERATYAARPSDAEGLRKDGGTVRRGIAAASGRAARWRARLFPASTMSAMADMAARIPEVWTVRIKPRLPGRRREARLNA